MSHRPQTVVGAMNAVQVESGTARSRTTFEPLLEAEERGAKLSDLLGIRARLHLGFDDDLRCVPAGPRRSVPRTR